MVKAIRVHATGGPEVLKYEDVDIPAPGAGEIQIRQHAIGVNFLDVYYRTGLYPTPLPYTPGNEGAGEVIALGKGVKGFKVGDRVAYSGPLGGYAEVRNLPAALVGRDVHRDDRFVRLTLETRHAQGLLLGIARHVDRARRVGQAIVQPTRMLVEADRLTAERCLPSGRIVGPSVQRLQIVNRGGT